MIREFEYPKYPSAESDLRAFKTRRASSWERAGEKMALGLFRYMAKNVPAYQKMLLKHKISPRDVRTIADLASVPIITKANYLRKNKYQDLFQ